MFKRSVVDKTKESRNCIICNHYHSLKVNFRFQLKACHGFYDLIQKDVSFNDVAIVSVIKEI